MRYVMMLLALASATVVFAGDPNAFGREYYHYMFEAAEQDAQAYQVIQKKLETAATALRRNGQLTPRDELKLQVYKEAHQLYGELAEWHLSLRSELAPDNRRPQLPKAWEAIVALEERIEELTKKEVVRSWVTPDEAEALQANGYKNFLKPEGNRFAFLRKHWMNKKEWEEHKLKMREQAAARQRAAQQNQTSGRQP